MLTSVYKMYGQLIVNLSIKSALGGQEERRGNHCDGTTDIRLNMFVDINVILSSAWYQAQTYACSSLPVV